MPNVGTALDDTVRLHFQNERIAGGRFDRVRFQLAEGRSQRDMLFARERLVAKEDHLIA